MRTYGQDLRWAMVGRDTAKLKELHSCLSAPGHVEIVEVDITDPDAVAMLVGRTKAIATTAGPFAAIGEPLVAACARHGTDYADLSGDAAWIRQMIDRYQVEATRTGARLVFTCGFDSVPSDLGVHYLQRLAREQFGVPARTVKGRICRLIGGLSGGTLASGRASAELAAKDPSIPQFLANPFALVPGFDGPPQPAEQAPVYDPDVRGWVAPFILAGMNTKTVHLSNALLGWPYGKGFVYDEMIMLPDAYNESSARDAAEANIWSNVQRALQVDLKPGEGPSAEELMSGSFEMLFVGRTADGREVTASVSGEEDPGYGSTSRIIAETALCLVKDRTDGPGGVWTAASALGEALQKRLEEHARLSFRPA